MSREFEGYSVAITGGANGIGSAIASAFSNAGAMVFICDIDSKQGEAVAQRLCNTSFREVDVRDCQRFESWMNDISAQCNGIDILINNVGVSEFTPLTEIEIEDFDRVIATNLRPTFILARAMAKYRTAHKDITQQRGARIINIASTRYLQSEAGSEAYAASKGGIVSLTHALAISMAQLNTTVNAISPGWIECGDYDALSTTDHSQHPSSRVGYPDDIANMCLYLASEKSGFINGQNFVIDGGMTKKMIYAE